MVEQLNSRSSTETSHLELAPTLSRWSVRAQPTDRAALESLFGLELPTDKLRAIDSGNGSALWLGPDEWLVLMSPQPAAAFRERHANADPLSVPRCSIVDVSHRNAGIHLSGVCAESVLNAGCPLDLSVSAFPPGACTRTLFGKAEIVLWRPAQPHAQFHIECWRSFLPYVWTKLQSAAADYPTPPLPRP